MKIGTVLTIIAVVASAMTVLSVLHAEADSSSAEITENGCCGQNAQCYICSDSRFIQSTVENLCEQSVSENLSAEHSAPMNNPVFEKDDFYDHIGLCPEVHSIGTDSRYL